MVKQNGLLGLAFLFISVFAFTAYADDGHFGGEGTTVFPMNEGEVRMVSENVVLRCAHGMAPWKINTTCEFIFTNPGKETEITMGFPAEPGQEDGEINLIKNFTTTVNGQPVSVEMKKVDKSKKVVGLDSEFNFDNAYVWKVKFATNQMVTILNTYEFEEDESTDYHGPGDLFNEYFNGKNADVPIPPSMGIYYILKTGALWDGRMSRADVSVELGRSIPPEFMLIKPEGYTYKEGVIHWHYENFKPTQDIEVMIHGGPLRTLHCQITDEFIGRYLNIHFDPKENPYDHERPEGSSGRKMTHKALQALEKKKNRTHSEEMSLKVNKALEKLVDLKKEVQTNIQKYPAEDRGYNLYMIHRYELFLGTFLSEDMAVWGILQQ